MGWIKDDPGQAVELPTAVGGIALDQIDATTQLIPEERQRHRGCAAANREDRVRATTKTRRW